MMGGRLPNLLIVGVPKSGTTSLFGYLTQHPDICGSSVKEVGYFHHWDPRGSAAHRQTPSLEAYASHFAHCAGERYAMEATPSYCYGGQPVIDAIRETLGAPKVIISLRDPTERLWSGYTFQRSKGNLGDLQSFEAYVDEAARAFRAGTDRAHGRRLQGLATGYYVNYLPAWIHTFGDDLKVVFAEALADDPAAVLAETFEWLGIRPLPASMLDLSSRNVTAHARSPRIARLIYRLKRSGDRAGILPQSIRGPLRRLYLRINAGAAPEVLSPETRARVEELYRPSNEQTARALRAHGVDSLPPWLEPDRR